MDLNLFMVARMVLLRMIFRTRRYFPGKFKRDIPTMMVRMPCPGKSSIIKPARMKAIPTMFLNIK